MTDATPEPIPFLRPSEEQIAKLRRQLENMFRNIDLVQDTVVVVGAAAEFNNTDLCPEIEHVLRCHVSDRLHMVKKTITEIVERFGGTTDMSEALEDERSERAEWAKRGVIPESPDEP